MRNTSIQNLLERNDTVGTMTILVIHMWSHLGQFYRNTRDPKELKYREVPKISTWSGLANNSAERLLKLRSDINS